MMFPIAESHALDQCGSAPKRSTRPLAAASITELSAEVKALRAGTPDVMKEFSAMARVGSGPKALAQAMEAYDQFKIQANASGV
jgi:hypothetical protein